jgi:predicted ATPase
MAFQHIALQNWRNFQNIEAVLTDRVFLTGPNASGKSNFLDAFRFLQELAQPGAGGLQRAIAKRQGLSKVRCLSARRHPDVGVSVRVEGARIDWTYEIFIKQDNQRRPIVSREVVRKGTSVVLGRPDKDDTRDPERLTQTHLEQVNVNHEFREVAELLSTTRYLHVVPQLVREPDRSVGHSGDPYGGDFFEQIAKTPKKYLDSRLRRITAALKVAVPQLRELRLDRDTKGTPHLSGLYEHWRPNAGWQSEDQFSDGTLRLLGLLWSALEGRGALLLEEPELSLNASIVRYLPQMFARLVRKSGRQVFISTHSPDLLSDEGIAPDEVLLLNPTSEGTTVTVARDLSGVAALLEGGATMADAVLSKVSPRQALQLSLFADR